MKSIAAVHTVPLKAFGKSCFRPGEGEREAGGNGKTGIDIQVFVVVFFPLHPQMHS